MRLPEIVPVVAGSVASAYLATHSAVVAVTVAAAVTLLTITADHDGSLTGGHCRCAITGTEEERS
ncbi:hypothetical protein Asp14428_22580 [Actinoplanes sp. NBRC 14428]|uniref:Uncharacterized protein n=1 Tax=Pseudosporangium ferrugineum TaxID=439699 RepID=A0A2T0RLE0_9ACTN|nr:hypothetical protein [Pseudosporangium ferrugineum]PRY21951.1 hypothetical protein CLV70_11816 [Pseudosporangium ferrugineum]BCJ50783.1 hypothetical protein Asp14428_22580 [Actinoplanes sp. NBRC 14428]